MSYYTSNSAHQVRLQPKSVKIESILKPVPVRPVPVVGVLQEQPLRPLLPKSTITAVPANLSNVFLRHSDLAVENGKCFLCCATFTCGYHLFPNHNTQTTEVLQQISNLLGSTCVVIVNPNDVICENCYNMLMYMSSLDKELEKVKGILRHVITNKSKEGADEENEVVQNLDEEIFRHVLPTIQTPVPMSATWAENFNRAHLTAQPIRVPKLPNPDFKCTMCSLQFDSHNQVKKHKIEVHLSTWTCHYCNEKFPEQCAYTDHMKEHLADELKTKCPNCDQVFASKDEAGEHHMAVHEAVEEPGVTAVAAFMCHECNIAFMTGEDFELHNQMHGDGDDLINIDLFDDKQVLHELVSEEFEAGQPHDLIGMIGNEDSQMETSGGLVCNLCESTFPSMEELKEHYTTEHDAKHVAFEVTVEVPESEYNGQVVVADLMKADDPAVDPLADEQYDADSQTDDTIEECTDRLSEYNTSGGEVSCPSCGEIVESEDTLALHICGQGGVNSEMVEVKNEVLQANEVIQEEGEIFDVVDGVPDAEDINTTYGVAEGEDFDAMGGGADAEAEISQTIEHHTSTASAYVSDVIRASKVFPCLHCDEVFDTKHKLFVHEEESPEHIKINCPDCESLYFKERELNEHREAAHSEWHCLHCQKLFYNLKQLKAHETRHVSGMRLKLQCPLAACGKIFQTQSGLRHHMVNHTGEFKMVCEFCNKGFSAKAHYDEHRATHTKEKRYECDICSKQFSVQATYWIHRKWHENPEPYQCTTCQKTFKHSSLLAVHKRKHTGERPYVCPYCPQSFVVSSSLTRHITLHTKVYPHTCKLCSEGFTARNKLATHMAKVHNDNNMLNEQLVYKNRKFVMTVDPTEESTTPRNADGATSPKVPRIPRYLAFKTNDGEQILLRQSTNEDMEILLDNQTNSDA